MARDTITAERLRELLHYDPETGIFTWRVARRANVEAGDVAGCIDKNEGYRRIVVDGRIYKAAHLAWLYMTGKRPAGYILRNNRNRADDRWSNLFEGNPRKKARAA